MTRLDRIGTAAADVAETACEVGEQTHRPDGDVLSRAFGTPECRLGRGSRTACKMGFPQRPQLRRVRFALMPKQ